MPHVQVFSLGPSVTQTPAIVTPSGRTIYRHANNKGSVVETEIIGTKRVPLRLFVADAKYRTSLKWGAYGVSPSISSAVSLSSSCYAARYASTTTTDTGGGSTDRAQAVRATTDANLSQRKQFTYNATAKAQLFESARFSCDAWLEYADYTDSKGTVGVPAVQHARSLTHIFPDGLDIPTMWELCVIFIESDTLDSIDPTADSYPTYRLGRTNTNGGRFCLPPGATRKVFTCNRYGAEYEVVLNEIGTIGVSGTANRYTACGVVPVYELDPY